MSKKREQELANKACRQSWLDWLQLRTYETGHDYFVAMARAGYNSIRHMSLHLDKLAQLEMTPEQQVMYTKLREWIEHEQQKRN